MDTIEPASGRRRRRHSAEFKAQMIRACQQPGVSSAAVALAHSVNANLLRRWVKEAERGQGSRIQRSAPEAFIALPVEAPPAPASLIRIELRRGPTTVIVQWPTTSPRECSLWLRELLR